MVIGWVACVATIAYGEGGANARVRHKKIFWLLPTFSNTAGSNLLISQGKVLC